nr:rab escort protein 1 [Quercus suber]
MSKDASSYPPIEPTNFDLIVLGTGLPEPMIATTAFTNGKTVLQLDPNPFYGSNFLSFHDLSSFLISHSAPPHSPPSAPSDDHNFIPAALAAHPSSPTLKFPLLLLMSSTKNILEMGFELGL